MLVYIPTSLFPDVMYGECLNDIQIQLEHSLNSGDINGCQWIRLSGDFKFCLHKIHPSHNLVLDQKKKGRPYIYPGQTK